MATTENSPKTTMPVTTTETPPTPPNLWYRLPGDILNYIAKRLAVKSAASLTSTNHLHALNLLRSVCASWRSSIDKPSSSFSFLSSLPLALPVPKPNPNSPRTCHFKLSHSTLYFLTPPAGASCWLLRVEEPPARNHDGSKTYHPLYPLSKMEPPEKVPEAFPKSISLLDVAIAEVGRAHCIKVVDYDDEERKARKKELKQAQAEGRFVPRSMAEVQADYEESYRTYVKKVAMSPPDHGVVAVVAVQSGRLCSFNLGACDDGQKWTLLDPPNDRYHDVVYRIGKGKYYAVDYRGRTVVINGTDLKKQTKKKVAVTRLVENALPGLGACQLTRLVESGNDLFLIDRYLNSDEGECTLSIGAITMGMVTEVSHPRMNNYFHVYRLDEVNKRWEPVDDLGHCVFFLGDDYVFSVDARDFPGLRGNCIYFAEMGFLERNEEEAGIGKSCVLTGVYDLKDRSCGPLAMFPDHWPIFAPPPAWLKSKHPVERMKEDELQRDVTGLKKDMPEPSPEAKRKAAEAKSRGDDAYKRKDYLVALDAYTQAIDFDPSDATLLSNRSVCWIRLGQAEHALTDAKACRALRPDWAKACYREGAALQLLQRFDEAAFSFKEGMDLDPDSEDLANAFRDALEAGKKFRGTNQ